MHTLIPGDFPKVILTAPDNARTEIYLHGAHVTSWITPDGDEKLYLSQRNSFRPDAALRGGIPVVFPQFSGLGPLPKHGFARTSTWEWLGAQAGTHGTLSGHFQMTDSAATRRIWDHAFRLDLTVTIGGPHLDAQSAGDQHGRAAL